MTDRLAGTAANPGEDARRRGYWRLAMGGFALLVFSAMAVVGTLLALAGRDGVVIETSNTIGAAPARLFLADITISSTWQMVAVLAVAVIGILAGFRLWTGGRPGIALFAALLWTGVLAALAFLNGTTGYNWMFLPLILLLLIGSGSLAERSGQKHSPG